MTVYIFKKKSPCFIYFQQCSYTNGIICDCIITDCQNDIEDYYDFLTDCAVRYISLNCFFLSLKQPR